MANDGDFVEITLDTPIGDIVRYDKENKELRFDPEPGKFRELPEDVKKQLGYINRAVYDAMASLNKQAKKVEANPPTPGLKIDPRYISPGEKLEVNCPPDFREKFHLAWLRAKDYAANVANGYSPVTESDVEVATPGLGTGSSKIVGTIEYDELVLMKIPAEEHMRRIRAVEAESKKRIGEVEATAIHQMRQAGGKEFIPPESGSDGRNWSELAKEEKS